MAGVLACPKCGAALGVTTGEDGEKTYWCGTCFSAFAVAENDQIGAFLGQGADVAGTHCPLCGQELPTHNAQAGEVPDANVTRRADISPPDEEEPPTGIAVPNPEPVPAGDAPIEGVPDEEGREPIDPESELVSAARPKKGGK